MAETTDKTVTINNVPYKYDNLSDEAKKQLLNLRVTDQEIERLQQQTAIAQTARMAYAKALEKELPAAEKAVVQ